MIFTETQIVGAFLLDIEAHRDERGWFGRSFCQKEFEEHGLNPVVAQCNVSTNLRKGTLRGMHSQVPPCEEDKLVRCTRGSIHDVMLDLRRASPSYGEHFGALLSAENQRALYIPKGVFHGFLTLEDDCEVFYQMSEFYAPSHGCGVRWNDPKFGIEWPGEVTLISDRDANYSDFEPKPGFAK